MSTQAERRRYQAAARECLSLGQHVDGGKGLYAKVCLRCGRRLDSPLLTDQEWLIAALRSHRAP